ncbi:uncharacterized protein LOC108738907 isoform X2 [Agrilus planipennis]|nr:uncharacterized protein LOC108738907 isoform X2 [Agrilus planipennis]
MESLSSSLSNATLVATERPRRVRTATISEGVDAVSEMDNSIASIASLLISNDHLETKRTIEQLRKQYGERWLQAESSVQDVLGLEKSLPIISSSPYDQLLSTFEANYSQQNVPDGSELKSEESMNGTETYTTASETTTHGNNENALQPGTDDDYDGDDDDDDVLGQGEENLYLVCPKGTTEPIFLVVTNTHIRERDCDSGKEKTRWPLDSLLACSASGSDPVLISLEFDTVKRDKKQREYDMVEEDAEKLSKHLSNLLSIMGTQNNRMVIFKCMKCGTRFGEEKNSQKRGTARVCPTTTCNSTLVIEDDEEN